jgi:hypothetical protein
MEKFCKLSGIYTEKWVDVALINTSGNLRLRVLAEEKMATPLKRWAN